MADSVFVAVTNIPSNFHAAHLRAHFSSLIESNSFVCFHFRHRPEKVSINTNETKEIKRCCVVRVLKTKFDNFVSYHGQHWTDLNGDLVGSECHVSQIKLKSSKEESNDPADVEEQKLLEMPELKPPELMPKGNVGTPTLLFLDFIQRCLLPHNLINKLQLKFPKTTARRIYGNVNFEYKVSDLSENTEHDDSETSQHRCSLVSELTRPYFKHPSESNKLKMHKSLINDRSNYKHMHKTCNEQAVVNIAEENLCLHSEHNSYTSVMNTGKKRPEEVITEHAFSSPSAPATANFHSDSSQTCLPGDTMKNVVGKLLMPAASAVKEKSQKLTNRERKRLAKEGLRLEKKLKAENIEEKLIAIERRYHNDEDAEEWDRHEASEDDPSNQERNRERLYEEEIEQPWEKGGPGVVFYTDAVFWQEKEGDFDEQTTDDLDVDFSAYEESGAGDKDIKDFLRIQQERRFREGYDDTDRFSIGIGKRLQGPTSRFYRSRTKIGAFESHCQGVGRKVMEKQGWKEGQGLGRSLCGIVDALKGEGQGPHNKRGLGYTDMKPVVYGLKKIKNTRSQSYLITSIYDDPKTTDPKQPLLQRSEPSTLKHRQSHLAKFS